MSDLSDAERESLWVAYRGPWGDDMVAACPPRLIAAVECIVAERTAAAEARAARLAEVVARVEAEVEGMRAYAAGLAPGGDWGNNVGDTIYADGLRYAAAKINAALASPASVPESSVAGSLAAQGGEVAPESTPEAAGPGEGLS